MKTSPDLPDQLIARAIRTESGVRLELTEAEYTSLLMLTGFVMGMSTAMSRVSTAPGPAAKRQSLAEPRGLAEFLNTSLEHRLEITRPPEPDRR